MFLIKKEGRWRELRGETALYIYATAIKH